MPPNRWQMCCGFCPYQPICGMCRPPCSGGIASVEVTPGTTPTSPATTSLSFAYTSSSMAINYGNTPQTTTVTFMVTQQLTATMQYADAFQLSEKTSFKVRCLEQLAASLPKNSGLVVRPLAIAASTRRRCLCTCLLYSS